jgi:hypothetical protein
MANCGINFFFIGIPRFSLVKAAVNALRICAQWCYQNAINFFFFQLPKAQRIFPGAI